MGEEVDKDWREGEGERENGEEKMNAMNCKH